MNAIEIIREAMKVRETSQASLADKIEGWSQSNITGILNNSGGNVKIANMYRMLDALGYEIVVRNKLDHEESWTVDYTKEDLESMSAKSKQIVEKRKERVAEKKPTKRKKKSVDLDDLLKD